MGKFLLAFFGYIVVTLIVAVGWHVVLFEDLYVQFGTRKEPLFHFGILATALQAFAVAYLYPKFYRNGSFLKDGLKFGALMGLFLGSYGVFGGVAKFNIEPVSDWILYESGAFFLQFLCVGLLVGFIYRKPADLQVSRSRKSHGL